MKDIEYQIQHGLDLGAMDTVELITVIQKLREHHRGMCKNFTTFLESTCGESVILKIKVHALEERNNFLNALEAAGVDNWEGYSHAIEMLGSTVKR